jgi:hypothetical protein
MEQTSISLSNDNESIKKQEPKKQVNIVISYIEKNDEQGIGQLVKLTFGLLVDSFWYISPAVSFGRCIKSHLFIMKQI